jgi:hypothetical protein
MANSITPELQQDAAPSINYGTYSNDLNTQKEAIQIKIDNHERKLIDLEMKETMLNNIITRTNATLESIDPGNFKWMGQTQANLMKQIENLGLLKDIIIKYEDMIFKYRKVLLEINEKDLGNRIRINTLLQEEHKEEDNINTVLADIQELLKNNSEASLEQQYDENGNKIAMVSEGNPQNVLLQSLEQELLEEDY